MVRKRKRNQNPDRYIVNRAGIYYYKRRVPTALQGMDDRGDTVRISLKTPDLALARSVRDIYEAADDELWFSLALDEDPDVRQSRYNNAIKRAQALGFAYKHPEEINRESLETILKRVEVLLRPQVPQSMVHAVMGTVDRPDVSISKAFSTYIEKVAPQELNGKSAGQKKRWLSVKQLAIDSFIEVVGDINIDDITRDVARIYYDYWMGKVAPKDGKPTHSASSANRRIGDIRRLYSDYYALLNEHDRRNPFEKMTFKERGKRLRRRPPFPIEWIVDRILKPGALATLNDEARGVILMVAETGARPSEICNLTRDMIVLDHETPHLNIEPRDDPDDPREIKTDSSIRLLPLHGLSLAVMKKFPDGFPRYKDKEDSMSATLNKYFKENDLLPTVKHSVYSLRHSFEDRMKEAKVDAEVRRLLMGHSIERPEYGEGGSLNLRLEAIKKVSLPFDPSIV